MASLTTVIEFHLYRFAEQTAPQLNGTAVGTEHHQNAITHMDVPTPQHGVVGTQLSTVYSNLQITVA